ncbi:hypothetical protein D3Z50_06865 [Clostridiaceae bacterium]|nr:hypothetical protein [Clostridiaceae bacterium]
MRDKKVQWHSGFVAAMNLELMGSRDGLIFEKEYNLNTKPLEIDLLIIRKDETTRIENEIGHIFRGHNILEYKSPEDHLNIDSFYKAQAYAALYKSYGESVDAIKADDITVTLVREARPEGLLRYFEENGCQVQKGGKGIYYIKGAVLFETQLIVSGELDKKSHIWLGALSGKMKKADLTELLENIRMLKGKTDRELADSVLEVSIGANKEIVEDLIGDESMCQALMELLEPQIQKREKELEQVLLKKGMKEGMKEGMKKGIQGMVAALRDFGHADAEIKTAIMDHYSLTQEEAESYLKTLPQKMMGSGSTE